MRRRLLAVLAAATAATKPLAAQLPSPTSWEIHADNDFFNFWLPWRERPDLEYTQGAEISATWSARPLFLSRLLPAHARCTTSRPADQGCTRLRVAIGQEMYTPSNDDPQLQPGDRPYAGWLYAKVTESAESRAGLDELSVTVGVTGPPSLAEAFQERWHQWFGFRKPLGWAGQLPFEPDVALSWMRARDLVHGSTAGRFLHVAPFGTVTLGTLATSVAVGANVTLGINPPPAWQRTVHRSSPDHVGLYVGGGVQSTLMLRNLFLDGDTFRSSNSVSKELLVGQLSGRIGLSLDRVRIEWEVIRESREYPTQPMPHTYSRILFRVGPGRWLADGGGAERGRRRGRLTATPGHEPAGRTPRTAAGALP